MKILTVSIPPAPTEAGLGVTHLKYCPMDRFIKNPDGTVTDMQTGVFGLVWKDADRRMQWREAMDWTASIGEGWRLPTVQEQVALVDYSRCDPATQFPGTQSLAYWSSTNCVGSPFLAWGVDFNYGSVDAMPKDDVLSVRAIREVR